MGPSVLPINPSSWIQQRAPEWREAVKTDPCILHSLFFPTVWQGFLEIQIQIYECKSLTTAKGEKCSTPYSILQS